MQVVPIRPRVVSGGHFSSGIALGSNLRTTFLCHSQVFFQA